MSRLRKLAARRLRVLYGATKPLPRPAGKYHVGLTEDEQADAFEAAARRRRELDWRGQRAAHVAQRVIFRKTYL